MVRGILALAVVVLSSMSGAARAAPPIEAYGKLPAMDLVTLSPSGDRYAFIVALGEQRRLMAATTDNKLLLSEPVGNSKVRGLTWAGDDIILVDVSATVNLGLDFEVSKHELSTTLVINLAAKKSFAAFKAQDRLVAGAVFGHFGVYPKDGHWYGYFGGVTYAQGLEGPYFAHGFPDLYRIDLESGDISLIAHGRETSDSWLMDPDGSIIARSLYDETTRTWSIMSGGMGGRQLASGKAEFGGAGSLMIGRTASVVFARPSAEQGYVYEEAPLDGGPPKDVEDSSKIAELLADNASGRWIGYHAYGDLGDLTLFDPVEQARWNATRKAFPGYFVHLMSTSTDFGRMIVFTDGQDDSGTYWFVDVAKGSAIQIGNARPDVLSRDVGAVRMVDYKAADGLAMRGVLTLPPGRDAKGLPVVVLPHGGPEDRDYPSFDWWAQAFASRGYAVFQPNFRGSWGYGQAFRNAGLGQWGRKMQTDISDGLAELVREGIVDPKRACIVGASYGGYAALAGVTVQQGLYRCAVSVAGVADLSAMLDYERDLRGAVSGPVRYWKAFLGVTSFWGDELKPISPARLAAQADAPILLIHGKDDTVVPLSQSREMEDALQKAGKPVELVVMPGEDHWLSREDTRVGMLTAAVAFVQKHNPPDAPAATPAEARR